MAKPLVVYVGTGGSGEGIYRLQMDQATGQLTRRDLTQAVGPGWVGLDPSERFLYAALRDKQVGSYAVDRASGRLTPLNAQPNGGGRAAHLSVDPTGQFVVTASWEAGTVTVVPLGADGRLGAATDVVQHSGTPGPHRDQTQARAHMCPFDPSGRWLLVTDLGLDRVYVYRLETATGKLAANSPPFVQVARGRGPRHIAFHPNGRLAYLINELDATMTAFSWDGEGGVLRELQTVSTLPDGWAGKKWAAQVAVHPAGRFVYGSNRGSGGESDDIAIFRIADSAGTMSLAGHAPTLGQVPRNFAIDPTGTFLLCAHQDSNTVVPFRIDQDSGALNPTGQMVEVVNPTCIQFAPSLG